VTHYHHDHADDLLDVVGAFTVARVVDNGRTFDSGGKAGRDIRTKPAYAGIGARGE
jgi:hypothetical protein